MNDTNIINVLPEEKEQIKSMKIGDIVNLDPVEGFATRKTYQFVKRTPEGLQLFEGAGIPAFFKVFLQDKTEKGYIGANRNETLEALHYGHAITYTKQRKVAIHFEIINRDGTPYKAGSLGKDDDDINAKVITKITKVESLDNNIVSKGKVSKVNVIELNYLGEDFFNE